MSDPTHPEPSRPPKNRHGPMKWELRHVEGESIPDEYRNKIYEGMKPNTTEEEE